MVADPTLWQVHCLRICPRRMMTTRTVTMDLLIRMMTMILGMVAAHLLRLGHWIRWAALSWSLRIVHQWMVLTFLPTQGGGRVAGVSGGRTSWGLPALCIQGVQERKWRLHPRNGFVSYQIAQTRVAPEKGPISIVLYIDATFLKRWIPIWPIYCKISYTISYTISYINYIISYILYDLVHIYKTWFHDIPYHLLYRIRCSIHI